MNAFQILHLTVGIFSFSILIQTIEFFIIRKVWANEGIWTEKIIAKEWSQQSHLKSLRFWEALWGSFFYFILVLRFISAVVLFFHLNIISLVIIWISSLAISTRWRGTYNGGSDIMTLVVASGILLSMFLKESELWMKVGLIYIGVQSIYSYFISGVIKIKQRSWRNGDALRAFFDCSIYETAPWPFSRIMSSQNRNIFLILSWMTLLFECLFPLSLMSTQIAIFFTVMAALFHFMNIFIFGLNRFFWSWAATWPCIIYCASLLSS